MWINKLHNGIKGQSQKISTLYIEGLSLYTYIPSTQEAEARDSLWVYSQPLSRVRLYPKTKKKNKINKVNLWNFKV